MKRLSHLAIALCAALAASSSWAQDGTPSNSVKNDDLRDLDLLIVTGATVDANSLRWVDEVNQASSSGQNTDVGTLATIVVTGARLGADDRRWH